MTHCPTADDTDIWRNHEQYSKVYEKRGLGLYMRTESRLQRSGSFREHSGDGGGGKGPTFHHTVKFLRNDFKGYGRCCIIPYRNIRTLTPGPLIVSSRTALAGIHEVNSQTITPYPHSLQRPANQDTLLTWLRF